MTLPKRILALLLTFILVVGIIPFTATKTDAETIKLGYIFETNVNIRSDASTSSEIVANVSKWNVTVLGSKNDVNESKNPETENIYVWYKISYLSSSKTIIGYVREDLIKVTEYTPDEAFEKSLELFPESYREDLVKLHALYPNWKFVADNVPTSFSSSVSAQDNGYTKLVETSYNSWRSMREKCYNWSTSKFITTDGGRYGASREVIAYYMDPRNFLNANDIYIYMQQSYDSSTQTLAGVQSILDGTFLEGKVTDKNDKYYGKPYAGVIRYAASQSGVNAYVLASTIIQEQGTKGATLGKGTTYKSKKVYNYFNYGASGTTSDDVLTNGKKYAYKEGWFTPTESIVGGAKKYGSGYISIGQDTYFYKNYNILNPDKIWHQYAQNVSDSLSSSRRLKNTYADLKNIALTFRIPVYESLPKSISKLPAKNDNLNNYYFNNIEVEGLSPDFNRYKTSYNLTVDTNTQIFYDLPTGASFVGENSYSLIEGENKITFKVKSQTGFSRSYTLNITATTDAVVNVISSSTTLVKEADGNWYCYSDGKRANITTLVKYQGKWFYVENGVWTKKTTLFKYSDKWFYIENGKWNNTAETMTKYNGVWFYIKNGKWDKSQNTLFKYSSKWFYIKNGKWVKDTLIFTFKDKDFYIKSGIAQLDFSGKKTINGKTYKIKNGKVF